MHSLQCCELWLAVPVKCCLNFSVFSGACVGYSLTECHHLIPCSKHVVWFWFRIIMESYDAINCDCLSFWETGSYF